ncbi:MAG: aminotransferase class V-fold PLP-dependent enzyme [Lachnospiraceae bacterium]|nr:aminotransferase class V-fold PLP-dependent enzyme [Lachnospiraceae bacterium]
MKSDLYNKLIEYSRSDYYGFHMPGHKRNVTKSDMNNPYSFDITEITGFDNLHDPEEVILQEMMKAKQYYGSDISYFLVNGSTAGNLSAVSAVAKPGEKIIMARNCHKSVYNVIELRKINVAYIYPKTVKGKQFFGDIDIEELEQAIKANPDAKAVFITSPTYEGIVSDVEKIANIAHNNNMALIVDQAHGAHFKMSDCFPMSAIDCGADVVIESLHKTLPSLTQTAILHYRDYGYVNQKKLEKYLSVYQSSSPSYVLMSSICNCIDEMIKNGDKLAVEWTDRIENFKKKVSTLKNIEIYSEKDGYDFDISKIVICLKENNKADGKWLFDTLRDQFHLEMEMKAGNYVLAMTSAYDTDQGFDRLADALINIDDMLSEREEIHKVRSKREDMIKSQSNYESDCVKTGLGDICAIRNKVVCQIHEVSEYDDINIIQNKIADIINSVENKTYDIGEKMSDKYVYMYPPGIPLIVPGEIPDKRLLEIIEQYRKDGYEIKEQL